MIRYNRQTNLLVVYWWGGIVRRLAPPSGIYAIFLTVLWTCASYCPECKVHVLRPSVSALGGFVMFLLVFRLNQCMLRHSHGNSMTAEVYSELEYIVQTFCTFTRGATKLLDFDSEIARRAEKEFSAELIRTYTELALVAKLNAIRLTLSLALSFVAHCWLMDAAATAQGEIDEEVLPQVVFLCVRLEGLLYPEEMQLIDEALCITKEETTESKVGTPRDFVSANMLRAARWLQAAQQEGSPVFRAEVNRHRVESPRGRETGTPLFGRRHDAHERTVVPLPKIMLQLLMDAISLPVDQPWGYPQRLMNYFVGRLGNAYTKMEELTRLVSQPLPLAYLQHCRILLFVYAFVYPVSVDPEAGFAENIFMPLMTFFTLYGFELLAADLENPLGMDEMDLNLLDMVHSLEVAAQRSFDVSELGRSASRRALRRPFEDFGMHGRSGGSMPHTKPSWQAVEGATRPFSHFFCWQPVPTLILAPLVSSHGHVDSVHYAHWQAPSLRRLLRRSLLRWRMHNGGLYQRLDAQTEPCPSAAVGGIASSGDNVMEDMRKDPMIWCHYLALRRPVCSAEEHAAKGTLLSEQVGLMLRGTTAGSIFRVEEEGEDTHRSVLNSTPRLQGQYLSVRIQPTDVEQLPEAHQSASECAVPSATPAPRARNTRSGSLGDIAFQRALPATVASTQSLLERFTVQRWQRGGSSARSRSTPPAIGRDSGAASEASGPHSTGHVATTGFPAREVTATSYELPADESVGSGANNVKDLSYDDDSDDD